MFGRRPTGKSAFATGKKTSANQPSMFGQWPTGKSAFAIGKGENLKKNRVQGADFDEVLFADDTIIISECIKTIQDYLRKIEEVSGWYGMRLNKTKCEALTINSKDKEGEQIKFIDNTKVPQLNQVKYLGCMLNDKGDPKREINKRISECMVIIKKLDPVWKHTDNPT